MSFPNGLTITNKGRVLQAKAQTGVELHFTKIQIGDGTLSGQLPGDMTALISVKMILDIIRLNILPNGKALVGGYFSNFGLATGFYFKELGVFAQDPDVGEILYCYGNADTAAEYVPADSGGDVFEKYISAITIVGNASSVTATIDESLVYATQQDLQAVAEKVANYNSYSSNIDANGIYTVVDYKRADGTLYMKSTLSNPDANSNYQTDTWQFFDVAGTTVILTVTWTLTYDADGNVISKVVS